MKEKSQNTLIIIAILIAILSAIASIVGIFSNGIHQFAPITTSFKETIELYQKGIYARDSVSMATQAIAQDQVTLFLGVPLLIASIILLKIQKNTGAFLLSGILGYFLYTYVSYSILMTYNQFYLVYLVLMVLSFYGFLISIGSLLGDESIEKIKEKFPVKSTSRFLFIAGVAILFMWMGRIVPTMNGNTAPVGLEQYSTLGIQTLDLGFIVPACFVIGYLLRKGDKKGYVLSIVLIMKAEMMTIAVSNMAISMKLKGVEISFIELIFFPILFVICTFFVIRILKVVHNL